MKTIKRHEPCREIETLRHDLAFARREIDRLTQNTLAFAETFRKIADDNCHLRRSLRPWWKRAWDYFIPQP